MCDALNMRLTCLVLSCWPLELQTPTELFPHLWTTQQPPGPQQPSVLLLLLLLLLTTSYWGACPGQSCITSQETVYDSVTWNFTEPGHFIAVYLHSDVSDIVIVERYNNNNNVAAGQLQLLTHSNTWTTERAIISEIFSYSFSDWDRLRCVTIESLTLFMLSLEKVFSVILPIFLQAGGSLMIQDGILERILFSFSINRTIMVTILHNKLIRSINNWELFFFYLILLPVDPLYIFTDLIQISFREVSEISSCRNKFNFFWPFLRLKHFSLIF